MTIQAGAIIRAADLAAVANPPIARLRQTTAQTLTSGTWTPITYDAEDVDTDPDGVGGHSTTANTSRYTARYAGWYRVGGAASFAAASSGSRAARLAVNGVLRPGSMVRLPAAAVSTGLPLRDMLVYLAAGDYLEVQAQQDTGSSLNTTTASDMQSSVDITWERLA